MGLILNKHRGQRGIKSIVLGFSLLYKGRVQKKNMFFIHILWIRGGGGPRKWISEGRSMWIIFLFYNIIIKCRNVDKGGGSGKVDKVFLHFEAFSMLF